MAKPIYKKIKLDADISHVYNKLTKRKWWALFIIAMICLILILVDLSVGASNESIFSLISNSLFGNSDNSNLILYNLRIPHVLCSLLAGAILGICGCMLQSSLGNPLAAPSTIGVSQGASCGACIAIVCGLSVFGSSISVIIFAFIFALIPSIVIFCISKLKNFSATSIILTGIAMAIFFGGLVALIEYFADSSKIAEVVFWTFGSVYGLTYPNLLILAVMLIAIVIYSSINSLNLNALECGDTTAHSVGLNVSKSRLSHLIVAALGASCVTAFCGTINFIGLIAPHIMRRFVGSNYKYLIPSSAFCGAALLLASDLLSSIILPGAILPIGAITSFIGAPIFIWILMKKAN